MEHTFYNLVLFALATAGLTWIVVMSSIFRPIREFFAKTKDINKFDALITKIINCAGCFGFWSAGINYILIHYHCYLIVHAMAGSIITYSLFVYLQALKIK